MKGFIAVLVFALAMLVASCNDNASTETNAAASDSASKILASAEAASDESPAKAGKAEYKSQAGTEIEISKDQKVMIVGVAELDAKSKELEGLVAIEGKVVESYPDKGTIILVDVVDTGCGDDCATCPRARVPVRLTKAEGEDKISVPGVDETVIVIADLSLTETGYNLSVRELRPVKLS